MGAPAPAAGAPPAACCPPTGGKCGPGQLCPIHLWLIPRLLVTSLMSSMLVAMANCAQGSQPACGLGNPRVETLRTLRHDSNHEWRRFSLDSFKTEKKFNAFRGESMQLTHTSGFRISQLTKRSVSQHFFSHPNSTNQSLTEHRGKRRLHFPLNHSESNLEAFSPIHVTCL